MITSIAWKNVWRNKTRSLIVIAAVTIGVFAGIFSMAAINSSVVQRINAAVHEELSHIQVNNKDFRSSADIQNLISNYKEVVAALESTPGVTEVTGRVIVRGIASTATKSAGVEITGIDVEKEKKIFTISDKLIPGTGSYFETDTKYNMVFMGEKLAKELNIIRYIITPESINFLREQKVPSAVISKIEELQGERFTSDKKFVKAYEALLEPSEAQKYGWKLKEAAWSYREGSKLILSFLDINNNQTSAAFRISGIFRTNNDMFEELSLFVPIDELRRLTGLKEGDYHRVIARLENDDMTDRATSEVRQ
jgi:ABC-type lipoprotein release transport system permease subunit